MDAPVPAPRSGRVKNTGARAKVRNGFGPPKDQGDQPISVPQAPVRKKKKEAPIPPNSSLSRSGSSVSLVPKNSTLMSSTLSLPGLREDVSPIRPSSAMSNYSVSSIRSHKKRRAPPPPVQLSVRPIPEENLPLAEHVPSPVPSNASIITSFEAAQGDTSEETLHHKSPGFVQNPETDDKRQMYAKVNKVKANEVTHKDNYNSGVNGEFEVHESVIISDENEPDNHVYETVEIKKELIINEDHVVRHDYSQEKMVTEIDGTEDEVNHEERKKKKKHKEIVVDDSGGEVLHVKKKKKKKDKERDKSLENDEERKKKKKKKHKHKIKDDEHLEEQDLTSNLIITNENEEKNSIIQDDKHQQEISPLEIKRGDTTGDNNDTTEHVIETTLLAREKQNDDSSVTQNKLSEREKIVDDENNKREHKKKDNDVHIVNNQSELPELPSFRGAKAAEVHRMSQHTAVDSVNIDEKKDNTTLNTFESESDSLVNSDDELVDLFAMTSRKGNKQKNTKSIKESTNKKPKSESAKQKRFNDVKSSHKQHDGTILNLKTRNGTNSSDPAIQDTDSDVSDAISLAESENDSKYLSVSEQDENDDKFEELPKKITGKEIEEKKKSEIRLSMGAKANRRASQGGDVLAAQLKSETLRNELKNLHLQATTEPAYKREFREVELDINSDDDLLPSMRSSRSNSVINFSSEDETTEKNELEQEFAIKEMEKDVFNHREKVERSKLVNAEISKALDESYEAMSLSNPNNFEFTAIKDTIIVDQKSIKSDSPIIFEATNPKFSEESQQNYEFSDHDSVSTLSHPSNDDITIMSSDNLIVSRDDILTNLPDERGHHDMIPHTNMMDSTRQENAIKSPSPDSGIHDFADTCSSPVSINNDDQGGFVVPSSIQHLKMMNTFSSNMGIDREFVSGSHHGGLHYDATTDQTINGIQHNQVGTPDSGLDLQSSDVTSSEGNDVSSHDVSVTNEYEGGGMGWHAMQVRETMPTPSNTMQQTNVSCFNEDTIKTESVESHVQDNIERVELPKRHKLGKVLFTMSSYTDRKQVEQSNDVFRTESFNMVADKLNSSLAARQKLKMEGETKPEPHLHKLDVLNTDHSKKDKETSIDPDVVNYNKTDSSGLSRQKYSTKMQNGHKPSYTMLDRKPISFLPDDKAQRPASHTLSRFDLDKHEFPGFGQYAGTTDDQPDTFRSRIIEEFEAKKGIVIIASSGQDSLENPGPGEIARTHSSRAHYSNQSASAHTTNLDQTYLHKLSNNVKTELGHTRSLDRGVGTMAGGSERPWVAKKKSYDQGAGYASLDRGGRDFAGTRPGMHTNNSQSLHDSLRQTEQNHYDCPRSLMSPSRDITIYDSLPSATAEIPAGRVNSKLWQAGSVDKQEGVQTELRTVKETKIYRPGPPSISMGVWGEKPRASHIKIKEDADTIQSIGKTSHTFSKLGAIKHTEENLPFHRDGPSNPQVMEHKVSSVKEPVRKISAHEPDQAHKKASWITPNVQQKPIEIRYRNGHTTQVMEDPRNAVLIASKKSRGDKAKKEHDWMNASAEKTNSRVEENMPSRPKLHSNTNPAIPDKKGGSEVANDTFRQEYALRKEKQNIIVERSMSQVRGPRKEEDTSKIVKKDVQVNETINRSNPPPFYFGMINAEVPEDEMPSLRTAVGKVKDNEALSQPFRQQPRHIQSKNTRNTSKSNPVPNPQSTQINLKSGVNQDKIVIVKSSDSGSSKSSNNNNNVTQNQNIENRFASKIPPKERQQEEINRAFQDELLKAKSKLKISGKSESLSQSYSAPRSPKENDGSPPPPPPPVLPNTLVRKTPPVRENPAMKSNMNPREELMLAIRNKAGKGGLRPV
eukprot:GFUD01135516.1.p1 GENE.GFUD01135516.1~~GFUD01135516.1.p1  ORF type:complete len:1838 (+),score=444.40 GFUD01135516.1:529-6042(+)